MRTNHGYIIKITMMNRSHSASNTSSQPFSLSLAIQDVIQRAGGQADFDHLNAALGLSWMVCAVPDEPDLARWSLYARDAFLPEAALLFGLTIRAIHPPEAARGLKHAAEFLQHFEASYRPLIHRALENNQAVLSWRGWAQPCEMMWGIITRTGDEGAGFVGDVYGQSGLQSVDHDVVLESPPHQLYVVETIDPVQPDPNALYDMALAHACKILSNGLCDRFDVITGPAAYDKWIERCQQIEPDSEHKRGALSRIEPNPRRKSRVLSHVARAPGSDTTHTDAVLTGHIELAKSTVAAYESAIRFLQHIAL